MNTVSLPIRMLIAASTALVVTAGHIWSISEKSTADYDIIFFSLLLLGLLPSAIFIGWVRTPLSVKACGAILFLVTSLGWTAAVLVENDFRIGFPFLAFFITLGAVVAGAAETGAKSH